MAKLKTALGGLILFLAAGISLAQDLPVWELEGGSNRVMLLGSIHYLRSTDYPLPAGISNAYQQADALIMEIDMDSIDPLEASAIMMQMGASKTGSLEKSLSSSGYKEAQERAARLGIPLELFDQFEPWLVALTVTQMRMMQLGFDPNAGIEMRLVGEAARDGKNISGLETLQQQLGFMAGLDKDAQEAFLLQSLDDAETVMQQVESLVAAWRIGDAAALEDLMLEGFETTPELEQALLVERNRNWVSQIAELRNQPDDYLVVVGAMHLIGDNSVLAMLEDRGIESRQLSNSDLR